jgi:hypothetical protein
MVAMRWATVSVNAWRVDRIAINVNSTRLPTTTAGQLCCGDGPRQRLAG